MTHDEAQKALVLILDQDLNGGHLSEDDLHDGIAGIVVVLNIIKKRNEGKL